MVLSSTAICSRIRLFSAIYGRLVGHFRLFSVIFSAIFGRLVGHFRLFSVIFSAIFGRLVGHFRLFSAIFGYLKSLLGYFFNGPFFKL